jgi:hypothetical protein
LSLSVLIGLDELSLSVLIGLDKLSVDLFFSLVKQLDNDLFQCLGQSFPFPVVLFLLSLDYDDSINFIIFSKAHFNHELIKCIVLDVRFMSHDVRVNDLAVHHVFIVLRN